METLRYATLQEWAEAVCGAIRSKEGSEGEIPHQEVPDRILAIETGSDTSKVTAKPENVSESVQFLDAEGVLQYGTMPEVAGETVTLDGDTTSHNISEGHHGGEGVVQIVPDASNRFTPTEEEQEYTPEAGKVYTKIVLDPIPDIYKDVSEATMEPAYGLAGYTFFGKAGTLEEGEIVQKAGKQGSSVTSNGNRYIPVGYHDGTTYITVNVPQEITTIDGEDSTNCSAVASDVRYGETFRSGGTQKTGTLRNVSVPTVVVDVDTTSSGSYVQIEGYTNASTTEGILPAGSSGATVLKTIPKYTGSTGFTVTTGSKTAYVGGKYCDEDIIMTGAPAYSGPYTVTPSSSPQTLYTSECFLTKNITVNAAERSGLSVGLTQVFTDGTKQTYSMDTMPVAFSLQSTAAEIEKQMLVSIELHINETNSTPYYHLVCFYCDAVGVISSNGGSSYTRYDILRAQVMDDYTAGMTMTLDLGDYGLISVSYNDADEEFTVELTGDYLFQGDYVMHCVR